MSVTAETLGVVNPDLCRLLAYWQRQRGDRAMPTRADIDPLDFRYMLGSIVLVDVEPAGGDYRYRFRLVGVNVVEHAGNDLTGHYIEDYPGQEFATKLRESYTALVAGKVPRRVQRREFNDGRFYEMEALLLPLGAGGNVTMIMVALAFGPWEESGYLPEIR
ncbi:PAS domain-containing protein [Ferrovibrio sp.]|uniref:PAS domain-containing protein n=1 Tax=Ferrovibrio sp. TaxID=1917215 RepID=UPI003D0BF22E